MRDHALEIIADFHDTGFSSSANHLSSAGKAAAMAANRAEPADNAALLFRCPFVVEGEVGRLFFPGGGDPAEFRIFSRSPRYPHILVFALALI